MLSRFAKKSHVQDSIQSVVSFEQEKLKSVICQLLYCGWDNQNQVGTNESINSIHTV